MGECEKRENPNKAQQGTYHRRVKKTKIINHVWRNIQLNLSHYYFQEDLLIHGDSVYDIIDKQDHGSIQAELGRSVPAQQTGSHHPASPSHLEGEQRMFLCRMNVSRNARRQMRFGDQKVRVHHFYTNFTIFTMQSCDQLYSNATMFPIFAFGTQWLSIDRYILRKFK